MMPFTPLAVNRHQGPWIRDAGGPRIRLGRRDAAGCTLCL